MPRSRRGRERLAFASAACLGAAGSLALLHYVLHVIIAHAARSFVPLVVALLLFPVVAALIGAPFFRLFSQIADLDTRK